MQWPAREVNNNAGHCSPDCRSPQTCSELGLSKPGIRVSLNSEKNVSGIVHRRQSSTNQCANNDSNHVFPYLLLKSQAALWDLSDPRRRYQLPPQAGDVLPWTIVTTNSGRLSGWIFFRNREPGTGFLRPDELFSSSPWRCDAGINWRPGL